MPELPEVERATALLRSITKGNRIIRVETSEDNLVFQGPLSHEDFGREISGRVVKDAFRYGKYLYIELEGAGRMPLLHFGMTGMLHVRLYTSSVHSSIRVHHFLQGQGPAYHSVQEENSRGPRCMAA